MIAFHVEEKNRFDSLHSAVSGVRHCSNLSSLQTINALRFREDSKPL